MIQEKNVRGVKPLGKRYPLTLSIYAWIIIINRQIWKQRKSLAVTLRQMINKMSSETARHLGAIAWGQHVIHMLQFLKMYRLDLETRKHPSRRLHGVYNLDPIKVMS